MPTPAAERSEPTPPTGPAAPRGWLFGPWLDALLVANVAWPLIALAQVGDTFAGRGSLQFWQLYYVTAPHRWVTLLLVFADRERFRRRRWAFLSLAVAVLVACLGIRLTTGALTCLLAIDYVWNAWHFAAQHHGVYRVYGRAGDPIPGRGVVEKWAMRGFLLYVILRVAWATWADPSADEILRICDWAAVAVPVWLVLRDLARGSAVGGRRLYLVSVCALYLALLGAVHERQPGLVLSLTTASALFHALEYLALVSWSVRRRHADAADRLGLLGYLAPRWGAALAVFVVVLGAGGWLMDSNYFEAWLFVNVVVAFLHYAYDGMIWHRRAG